MSSNASTTEIGVSADSATIAGTDSATNTRTQFDVEREILCNYIDDLEQELARERQRRRQVVDRYEQLLENERHPEPETESTGLLDGLF